MRPTTRLFAVVSKRLEPGAPTGLTGLKTHRAPRSALLYLYRSTLRKLEAIPPHSIYRQSVEALTKQRLTIIESAVPDGYKNWIETVQWQIHNAGEAYAQEYKVEGEDASAFLYTRFKKMDKPTAGDSYDPTPAFADSGKAVEIDPEPQYSIEQVNEIEAKIGAGLLEEVIQVAEGEKRLVDEMVKSKSWEELVEPAPEGQWSYHERSSHGPGGSHTATQKAPQL